MIWGQMGENRIERARSFVQMRAVVLVNTIQPAFVAARAQLYRAEMIIGRPTIVLSTFL